MKKVNPAADYAAEAFRHWAACGCRTYADEMARIVEECDGDSEKLESTIEQESPYLLDILACEKAFHSLQEDGKNAACEAVGAIYMTAPLRRPKRKEITARVVAFAQKNYISESQVYRYLREVFQVFGIKRGLRVQ